MTNTPRGTCRAHNNVASHHTRAPKQQQALNRLRLNPGLLRTAGNSDYTMASNHKSNHNFTVRGASLRLKREREKKNCTNVTAVDHRKKGLGDQRRFFCRCSN